MSSGEVEFKQVKIINPLKWAIGEPVVQVLKSRSELKSEYCPSLDVERVMRPTNLEILSYQVKEFMEIAPYSRINQMREALK